MVQNNHKIHAAASMKAKRTKMQNHGITITNRLLRSSMQKKRRIKNRKNASREKQCSHAYAAVISHSKEANEIRFRTPPRR
jgi:hypothetical protein